MGLPFFGYRILIIDNNRRTEAAAHRATKGLPEMKPRYFKALAVSLMLTSAMATAGIAQAVEDDVQPLINEKVVVTARKPAETRHYVEQITQTPFGAEQLARWDDRICVGVSGVKEEHAQFLADRVSQRAVEVGLRTGKPGCKPDISILVTAEPATLVDALEEQYKPLFAVNNELRTGSLGKAAFEQFKTEERPVRWWHVSQTMSADGARISGEARAGLNDGVTGAPKVRSEGSRLRAATREDLSHAIIVVDANQVQGIPLEALGDYLAFVALMQADPNGNTSNIDTIMNLFRTDLGDKRPASMTSWDKDFLRALYTMPRNTASITQARSFLAQRMERK